MPRDNVATMFATKPIVCRNVPTDDVLDVTYQYQTMAPPVTNADTVTWRNDSDGLVDGRGL